ncbi:MAG TPA: sporulation histidine kinase inhibitor Sda [Bacillota bacterium]|nr:sporulation histidine kinase inhibitor Sda [Bacillota bacterium]
MEHISDELLMEAYHKAKRLNLSPDFLSIIEEELQRRDLSIKNIQHTS